MSREDWIWVAIRIFGIYLVVLAIGGKIVFRLVAPRVERPAAEPAPLSSDPPL